MAGDFDILYPAKKRQDFGGGQNNKFEKHLIQDNESPECFNVVFDAMSVQTRPGTSKVNTSAVGSFAGHGLYTRHDINGNQTMCAWFNGSLFALNVTTFVTIASAQSIFTAGQRVAASEYENYIFFNNGYNEAYKYNGAFTRHGVPAPASSPTAASAGTGNITAGVSVQYKVTGVNSNLVEGDVSSNSVSFSITATAAGQLTVSNIYTFPVSHGVNARNLYRATSGGTFMRVATINDNTTTSYTDNIAYTALGVDAPTDQGTPPKYNAIITHQNRLFCNDTDQPNLVWYSELGNPYVFKATSFEEIGDFSGDLVKGFDIHDNGLVVKTNNSNFMIYMPSTDPDSWSVIKLRSSYGSKSPFGSFTYNNKIMFPAVQADKLVGFAAISGDAVDPEATLLTVSVAGSEMKSDRIEPDIFEIQNAYMDRISAITFKNKAYISVTYGTNQTTNNRIYVFDFSIANLTKKQEASWVPWTGLNAEQFTVYNGDLYYQTSTATGFVYKMLREGVFSDDGTAINSYFWTKEYSGNPGDEQFQKDFRYANLLYERAGAYYMKLNYKADSENGDGQEVQIDLDPGSSVWGSMVWGVDLWSGGSDNGEERIYLGQLRGKRIQFRFSNGNVADRKFKVIGLQFGYNRKGRR